MRKNLLSRGVFGLIVFCSALHLNSAMAFDISVFGTMPLRNPNVNSVGGGATVGFDLGRFFSLETGALMTPLPYSKILKDPHLTTDQPAIQIPVLLRFAPLSLISFNGGPYYDLSSSLDRHDHGLMAGVSLRLPVIPFLLKLRFDALYQFGMRDMAATPGAGAQYVRNLNVLAGVMLDIF